MTFIPFPQVTLLAVETAERLTAREWDFPETPLSWLILVLGGAVVLAWVIRLGWRDTRELPTFWRVLLLLPRLAVFAILAVIALNPQERTQELANRPSRIVLLADTSLSMRHPASDDASSTADAVTRASAIEQLVTSPVMKTLRQTHEVSIYTFDGGLEGPAVVLPQESAKPESDAAVANARPDAQVNWPELLTPRGIETRLGEALSELIGQVSGSTLSGIVVLSDGGQNAGIDLESAGDRARSAGARLVTVGLGGTAIPVNLAIGELQSPTDVQFQDAFDLTALLIARGAEGDAVQVELSAQQGEEPPQVVESRAVQAGADGTPLPVVFSLNPSNPGKYRYSVTAKLQGAGREVNADDNERSVGVEVFDRPTRVLLVAGGPMREYHFVRNLLHRHRSFEVDVYLQTAETGTSQESDRLLSAFPSSREELFQYDLIYCFDPDWRLFPLDSFALLRDWVFQEAGGLVIVAGDVNTPQLAAMGGSDTPGAESLERSQALQELLPVVLGSYYTASRIDQDATQPWPVDFTDDARTAEFLRLTDDPLTSETRWKEFPGVFRCYPTTGAKAGSTIYAYFSDPRTQFEAPVLMASQFFGQGRVFYLGSGEMWRLRSVSVDDYDRFWIKLGREVAQGRGRRGTRRGVLLPESRQVVLGRTLRVRARVLDGQFNPLTADSLPIDVIRPDGRPLLPAVRLEPDAARPGEFSGSFRATMPGTFRVTLPIPESRESVTEEVQVAVPRLEDDDPRQNVSGLQQLASLSGGEYLAWSDAAEALPRLLPDRSETFLVDQRLRTLWDRGWMMGILVALLSVEWLIRKLWKLA